MTTHSWTKAKTKSNAVTTRWVGFQIGCCLQTCRGPHQRHLEHAHPATRRDGLRSQSRPSRSTVGRTVPDGPFAAPQTRDLPRTEGPRNGRIGGLTHPALTPDSRSRTVWTAR